MASKLQTQIQTKRKELKDLLDKQNELDNKKLQAKFSEVLGNYYRIPLSSRRRTFASDYLHIHVQQIGKNSLICAVIKPNMYSTITTTSTVSSYFFLDKKYYRYLTPANQIKVEVIYAVLADEHRKAKKWFGKQRVKK